MCEMFHVFTSLLEVFWVSIHPGADVLDRMPFYEGKTSAQKDGSHGSYGSEFSKDSHYRNSTERGKVKTNSKMSILYKKADLYETILSFDYVILLFCVHCSFR